jgi:hypothetical protein
VALVRSLTTLLLLCACLLVAAEAADAGLPACASAPCRSDKGKEVVILDYFRDRHLPRLIRAVKHSGLPGDTPVYYGSYWGIGVNTRPPPKTPPPPRPPGKPKPVMPGRRFSPIFSFARTGFWNKRRLPRGQKRRAHHRHMRGRIPSAGRLLHRSGHYRYQAGLEVGRRFRDRIRYRRARHQRVVTWQFDEIPSEVARQPGYRPIVAGILRGLTHGRGELHDHKLPGIVFVPGRAIGVRDRGFWRAVSDSALYLVGEEYPRFAGSPRRAARGHASWRHRIHRVAGKRLARRYVAGMTPGYRMAPGLGGNVDHRSHGYVRRWRAAYVRARARLRVAGFAQYNFNYRNAHAAVMNDVLRALGRGVRVLRR